MEGWKEVKLNKLTKVINGFAFKSKDFSDLGEIPIIKIKSLKNEILIIDESAKVSSSFLELNKKYHINKNDIVIALTGSHITQPASAVGRVAKSRLNETLLLNQRVGKFKVNEEICDHDFLFYFLNSEYFFENIGLRARGGSNQANISGGDVLSIKINLPPLNTQRKIATILTSYDDLIENNLKRIKLLEEQAQQTYEEWFVRFKFPGYEDVAFDEESGLPVGWEKVKLVECANLVMGTSPKSEFYNNEEIGLPFHQGVKDYGFRFPTNSSWSTQGKRLAEEDFILFSVRAPVGRLNVAIEKLIIGRGLASINHKRGWNSFLLYQLQNIFYEDNLMGGGAIYNSVTKKDVERIDIIQASEKINIKFNDFASNIDKQIKNLTKQNQYLKEARDILLPRLMSGMIDPSASSGQVVDGLEVNAGLGIIAEESVNYGK
ncbi:MULTISPECIES: restriction endonuclease subunit S [Bizionia]|nr:MULTISPECIES: restriction endonuclease subunit S [Bizionia]